MAAYGDRKSTGSDFGYTLLFAFEILTTRPPFFVADESESRENESLVSNNLK
jgi:hypothetical protein